MKKIHSIVLVVALISCGLILPMPGSEEIRATFKGSEIGLEKQKLGNSVELVAPDGAEPHEIFLRVKGTPGKQTTAHLFDIEKPVVPLDAYAVDGFVRYEGVESDGFLEMWNHLPAKKGDAEIGQSFFSRTVDVSGPMGKLSGDSDWRAFQLPAIINDGTGRRPLKLTLNVVLPGEGIVEIRGLRLRALQVPPEMKTASGFPFVALAAILGFLFGAAVVGLVWFLKKRRADSELRRIQALDS